MSSPLFMSLFLSLSLIHQIFPGGGASPSKGDTLAFLCFSLSLCLCFENLILVGGGICLYVCVLKTLYLPWGVLSLCLCFENLIFSGCLCVCVLKKILYFQVGGSGSHWSPSKGDATA